MNLYGKHTRDVAERIVESFREPGNLPKALAPIFINRSDDIPCARWSWYNQLLVALSGTSDARGFNQWKKVGRKVKKGSKAIWILAPCIRTEEEIKDGRKQQKSILYGFRSVPVFSASDTDGEAIPAHDEQYDSWVKELPLLDVADSWGIDVSTYTHGGSALGYCRYSSTGNKAIALSTENLSTWAHEMVHAADHRVAGLKESKWHKEVVAELGSATLLTCIGENHEADLGGAYDYIQHYAEHANKPIVKACMEVIARTCECVKLILDTAEQLQTQSTPA